MARFGKGRKFTEVQLHEDRLGYPLRWKKPRRVFVNSMSDLFHPSVETLFIAEVFSMMQRCPQHTFMILTKRPERMKELLIRWDHGRSLDHWPVWPLPNVWLGVSVENQAAWNLRVPYLLQTPAEIHFVSMEPLLGPVDMELGKCPVCGGCGEVTGNYFAEDGLETCDGCGGRGNAEIELDWVICGGESGPAARPMHPDWARSLRDECQDAGVPFFFKQWGEWWPKAPQYGDTDAVVRFEDEFQGVDYTARHELCLENTGSIPVQIDWAEGGPVNVVCQPRPDRNPWWMLYLGKKAAGRELDGREWNEYPER